MHTTTSAAIGANIRAEMARRGVSQQSLALALAGMSQPSLSKRLRGVVPFDVDELNAVATELGVTEADLWPTGIDAAS